MRKLLLGMFACLALSVQAQTFGEPTTVYKCDFANFFVKSPFMFTTEKDKNKPDCTITIYNDEMQESRKIVLPKTSFNDQDIDIRYSLITVEFTNGYDVDDAVLTQNLFNNDDKLEFIRGTYKLKAGTSGGGYNNYELTKAELISEDGTLLANIPVAAINARYVDESWVNLAQLGNNYYLYSTTEESSSTDKGEIATFYKITKGGDTGVSFTKAAEFRGFPNPVRPNEVFTIQLDEAISGNSNSIEISDMNGRIIHRQAIDSSEVKVPTRGMKGMYIYTILSDGKAISTGKVIVQ